MLVEKFENFMKDWDAVVIPSQALLTTTNLTGNPQVVVKCGFTDATLADGRKTPVPRTIGFLGKIYDEGSPLRVALAYEQATGLAQKESRPYEPPALSCDRSRRAGESATAGGAVPDAIRNLKPLIDGIQPISDDERRARIDKARRLMRENRLSAVVLEGGSSLFYYTGTRKIDGVWILPGRGAPVWVSPESQARTFTGDVRTFTETEGPYKKMAAALAGSRIGHRGAGSLRDFRRTP